MGQDIYMTKKQNKTKEQYGFFAVVVWFMFFFFFCHACNPGPLEAEAGAT